jgi:hypothetical protein
MQIVKGRDNIREYKDSNTKSGVVLSRHFCSNCVGGEARIMGMLRYMLTILQGCPMYLTNPTFKNFYALHGGCIAGRAPQPSMELFEDDKYSWLGDVVGKSKL